MAGNPHGNRSSIEVSLSTEDKAEFDRLLATGRLTLDGLTTWLAGKGYEISRSAVHRYKGRFDRMAARLRQSREMTQALAQEMGDAQTQGQQGRALVEMARSFVFDLLTRVDETEGGLDPKEVALIGKGLSELARAARYDQDFESKVEEARARAMKEAASTAETAAREAGLSDDVVQSIKTRVMGQVG